MEGVEPPSADRAACPADDEPIAAEEARGSLVELGQVPQVGWTLPVGYSTQTAPQTIAVADLNGDGRLDLVVSNRSSNSPVANTGVPNR